MSLRSCAFGILLASTALVLAQTAAPPPGWTVTNDKGEVDMRPDDGSAAWLSLLDLKEHLTDLGAWILSKSPKVKIDQSDRLLALDGSALQIAMAEDPASGKFLVAMTREGQGRTRVAMLVAENQRLASANLGSLASVAQMTSAVGATKPKDAAAPPNGSHKQLIYGPGSRQFMIVDTADANATLQGTYAYGSNLFASPIGAIEGKWPVLQARFDGKNFQLNTGVSGTLLRDGTKLALHYSDGPIERVNVTVLAAENGAATRFAIGPCVYIRSH